MPPTKFIIKNLDGDTMDFGEFEYLEDALKFLLDNFDDNTLNESKNRLSYYIYPLKKDTKP